MEVFDCIQAKSQHIANECHISMWDIVVVKFATVK